MPIQQFYSASSLKPLRR